MPTNLSWSVRPDVGVKSSPNVSKSCPNSSNGNFYKRMRFFKNAQKVAQSFGLLLLENLSPRTFKIIHSGHTGRNGQLVVQSLGKFLSSKPTQNWNLLNKNKLKRGLPKLNIFSTEYWYCWIINVLISDN